MRLEVGVGTKEELVSVKSYLALGSATRPHLHRVFNKLRAAAFTRAAIRP